MWNENKVKTIFYIHSRVIINVINVTNKLSLEINMDTEFSVVFNMFTLWQAVAFRTNLIPSKGKGEEKPWKHLTQVTCPDRGSNPGPLRDRRACCWQAMKAHGECRCKGSYIHSHGTRKR